MPEREIVLGDTALTLDALVRAARDRTTTVRIGAAAQTALDANALVAQANAAGDSVYGRTTGVGANRHVQADDADGLHGRRLLRSHCAGAGPLLPADVGRALMIVRINQLAKARSGIAVDVVEALVEACNAQLDPIVRRHGGVGTGDIAVLAELGLSLLGERPWADGRNRSLLREIDASAGLPLMSSSAPTLAVAALGFHDTAALVDAMLAVAALSAYAVRANQEAWTEAAASARVRPGVGAASNVLRRLVPSDLYAPARLQDPFGWRTLTSVHGALLDVLDATALVLGADVNNSAENPLHLVGGRVHHGAFHHAALALALDQLRLAVVQACGLSLSRLTKLQDPAMTGLRPFLADGPAGSSGVMVLEYTAASAFAELRSFAQPSTLGTTAISLGLEDHASFAWQSALAVVDSLAAVRTMVSCELVAALRAVRQQAGSPEGSALAQLVALCDAVPDPPEDHPLVDDLAAAAAVLDGLALEGAPPARTHAPEPSV